MSDTKISQLTELTTPAGEDLLLITDSPSTEPVSKKMTINTLFGNINWNVTVSGSANVTLGGNVLTINSSSFIVNSNTTFNNTLSSNVLTTKKLIVEKRATPASSNISSVSGELFSDGSNLYFASANNVLKKVALVDF